MKFCPHKIFLRRKYSHRSTWKWYHRTNFLGPLYWFWHTHYMQFWMHFTDSRRFNHIFGTSFSKIFYCIWLCKHKCILCCFKYFIVYFQWSTSSFTFYIHCFILVAYFLALCSGLVFIFSMKDSKRSFPFWIRYHVAYIIIINFALRYSNRRIKISLNIVIYAVALSAV